MRLIYGNSVLELFSWRLKRIRAMSSVGFWWVVTDKPLVTFLLATSVAYFPDPDMRAIAAPLSESEPHRQNRWAVTK